MKLHISPTVMAYVVDPLERAARTFIQQFVVILMATGSAGLLVHQNWLIAVDSAGFAALVSLVTSIATFKVPTLSPLYDLLLRVVKTFLQSFAGTLAAAEVLNLSHVDWKGDLAVAIPVALTALLTGLAALGVPFTVGASLLPAGTTEAVVDGDSSYEMDPDAESQKMALADAESAPAHLDSLKASDDPDDSGKHRAS